jgi:hypothetical protein
MNTAREESIAQEQGVRGVLEAYVVFGVQVCINGCMFLEIHIT